MSAATHPDCRHIPALLPVLLLLLLLTSLPPLSARAAPRCFAGEAPAITNCIDGRIRTFWEQQGGLPVFGYPLTPAIAEQTDAGPITVQWFERARLEHHPQNAPPYDVLLGRLGADALAQQEMTPAQPVAPRADCRFFAETGQNLCPPFLATWSRYGLELGDPGISPAESLALFGMPLGPPQPYTRPDGTTVTAQWFERARFEDHGATGVLLGLLGREALGLTDPTAPDDPTGPVDRPAAPEPEPDSALPPGGFIEVSGTQLTRLGQPVQFKGVNYYPRGKPWKEMWHEWDALQIERELRLARDQLGINAVRILYPFELSFHRSSERKVNLEQLDRLREFVQIAGDLELRVIVTLFDFYEDFPPPGSREEEENLIYLRTILGNFAGDDRIFAWDLHNEPDHYPMWQAGQAAQVLTWLGRMADAAHAAAPNHLITVGMGQYDNLWQPGPDGRRVIDYSDVISVHIYNAPDAVRQLEELRRYTDKPILLQEFGWPTGPTCAVRDYTEAEQAQVYRTMLEAAQGRVAGVFAWTLRDFESGPTRRWDTREEHYGLYRPDDSLKPAAEFFRDYRVAPLPSATQTDLPLTAVAPNPPSTELAPIFIEASGHYIKDWFRIAWEELGGQGSFGLPLSEAYVRERTAEGEPIVVQYFEAAVLELHPDVRKPPYFGELLAGDKAKVMLRPVDLGRTFAAERSLTPGDHDVQGAFGAFYKGVHGEWRLGEPLSGELTEEVNGVPTRVQYFERGRLEWNADTQAVEVSRLGSWAWDIQCRHAR
jgi:hypothetical protein